MACAHPPQSGRTRSRPASDWRSETAPVSRCLPVEESRIKYVSIVDVGPPQEEDPTGETLRSESFKSSRDLPAEGLLGELGFSGQVRSRCCAISNSSIHTYFRSSERELDQSSRHKVGLTHSLESPFHDTGTAGALAVGTDRMVSACGPIGTTEDVPYAGR